MFKDDIENSRMFNFHHQPVIFKDNIGKIIYSNAAAAELSRKTGDCLFPSYCETVSTGDAAAEEIIKLGIADNVISASENGEDKKIFLKITQIILYDVRGLPNGTCFIFEDVTQMAEKLLKKIKNFEDESQKRFLSKDKFKKIFSIETQRALRYKYPLCVVAFAYDGLFQLGSPTTKEYMPELLLKYESILKSRLRETDIIFNMGGINDYIALLPHTGAAAADMVFKRINQNRVEYGLGHDIKFGISEYIVKKHFKNEYMLIEEAMAARRA